MSEDKSINPGERKQKRGKRPERPNDKVDTGWIDSKKAEVLGMAKLGCTDEEIADILQIAEYKVRECFRLELDTGRANIRAAIRKAQLEKALTEKCTKMLIWLGKMYLGQREPKSDVDVTHNMKIEPVFYGEVAAQKAKERNSDS